MLNWQKEVQLMAKEFSEVVFKVWCVTFFFIVIIFAAACKKQTISSYILNLKGKKKKQLYLHAKKNTSEIQINNFLPLWFLHSH